MAYYKILVWSHDWEEGGESALSEIFRAKFPEFSITLASDGSVAGVTEIDRDGDLHHWPIFTGEIPADYDYGNFGDCHAVLDGRIYLSCLQSEAVLDFVEETITVSGARCSYMTRNNEVGRILSRFADALGRENPESPEWDYEVVSLITTAPFTSRWWDTHITQSRGWEATALIGLRVYWDLLDDLGDLMGHPIALKDKGLIEDVLFRRCHGIYDAYRDYSEDPKKVREDYMGYGDKIHKFAKWLSHTNRDVRDNYNLEVEKTMSGIMTLIQELRERFTKVFGTDPGCFNWRRLWYVKCYTGELSDE